MEKLIKINEQITVGPQPSEQELAELKRMGFKSIVNVRAEGEKDQPLSPQVEGDQARAMGLHYVHIAVPMGNFQAAQVDQFRVAMAKLPQPVFSHCLGGKRAGVLAMMHEAVEEGLSGEEAITRANEKGLNIDKPELAQFMTRYVDEH